MTKNKMKLFTIILSVLFIFTTSLAYAENEIMPISENPETPITTTTQDPTTDITGNAEASSTLRNNMKQGDVYLTGDNITVDYVVDGNLFVAANSVTINSEIGGDAFIVANEITVAEQGYVFSNLFTIANIVNVKGVVYDVYAIANNINISGYVYRDVKGHANNNISILGTVGRNAFFSGTSNILLKDTAENSAVQGTISGNLEYTSKSAATIPEGTVGGEVKYSQKMANDNTQNLVMTYLTNLGSVLALLIIVWLLLLWLAPKFLGSTNKLVKTKPLPVVGFGILGTILIPIICIILLILGITATTSLIILALYFLILAISSSIFAISANNLVCEKLKIDKTIGKLGTLILTGIILWAICLIPYIGSIITLVVGILGFGIILTSLISKKDKEVKEKKENKEKTK